MTVECRWRDAVGDDELEHLHAEAFSHELRSVPWGQRLDRHSLGWVCARDDAEGGRLVGFVNVIGDGGVHAVLLDAVTAESHRRRGIGRSVVATAVRGARDAGCTWMHVDHEPHLLAFYRDACGFEPTAAGLLRL